MARIERATSPLPRECSTTEPHGPADPWPCGPPIDRLQFEKGSIGALVELERETGIEPASLAWKASALPLSYTRLIQPFTQKMSVPPRGANYGPNLVEGVGFEPT